MDSECSWCCMFPSISSHPCVFSYCATFCLFAAVLLGLSLGEECCTLALAITLLLKTVIKILLSSYKQPHFLDPGLFESGFLLTKTVATFNYSPPLFFLKIYTCTVVFSRYLTKEAFIDYICMCVCLLELLFALHKVYFLSSSVPNWQALGAGLPSLKHGFLWHREGKVGWRCSPAFGCWSCSVSQQTRAGQGYSCTQAVSLHTTVISKIETWG